MNSQSRLNDSNNIINSTFESLAKLHMLCQSSSSETVSPYFCFADLKGTDSSSDPEQRPSPRDKVTMGSRMDDI